MRRFLMIVVVASSGLAGCSRGREHSGPPPSQPQVEQPKRDTGPWVRVGGSALRQELDTATIVRGAANVYQGWVRRPIESAQGVMESYRARYEVDCLTGLVRATRAAIYGENGALKRTLSPAEISRSGEGRWSDVSFRDLAVVGRAICDRVRDANLPIVGRRGGASRPPVR
jgi:hypothetical protein